MIAVLADRGRTFWKGANHGQGQHEAEEERQEAEEGQGREEVILAPTHFELTALFILVRAARF
jgi:hypothetical protein